MADCHTPPATPTLGNSHERCSLMGLYNVYINFLIHIGSVPGGGGDVTLVIGEKMLRQEC